jgi:hypothetical protein
VTEPSISALFRGLGFVLKLIIGLFAMSSILSNRSVGRG